VARDFLIDKGLSPPIVTDEWWLDVAEIKEAEFRFPDLNIGHRWIFPLPFPRADRGKERGLNIAWTALQLDWMAEGQEENLCQLTHPERIHDYLRRWPGLLECAKSNPGILAMYAPQLTIPGFDDGFADAFDQLLNPDREDAYQMPGYGPPETTDGKSPLCGELIAWRHSTYGNYVNRGLSSSFVKAYDHHYSRHLFDSFECLAWLLSNAANWMPQRLRDALIDGMRSHELFSDIIRCNNAFSAALLKKPRSKFLLTRAVRSAIVAMFAEAIKKINVQENASALAEAFIDRRFFDAYYDEQDRFRILRKGR
jgi:hypothetical protein